MLHAVCVIMQQNACVAELMVCGVYRFQMKEKMWKTPCKRRQISLFIGKVMKNGMQFKVFFLIYINLFSIFELF